MSQQHPYSSPARPATNDAFSVVMRAQAYGRTSPAVDFSEVLAEFQQSLGEDDGTSGEAAWGAKISQTITKMVHEKVVPQATDKYAHIDTRINALHLLIDTAMGIAYAPPGIASDSVRSGTAPRMIVLAIYEILSKMTEMDIRRMGKDEVAFLDKVTELRLRPREPSNNTATWKDLDDVLRLLGYTGPVDFRVVFGNVKYCIENGFSSVVRAQYMRTGKNANSDYVVRIIRNSIVAYVSPSSCFETKINALNALADIGICEMDGGPWGDEEGTAERYLCNTIFDVAKMLSEKEVATVASDMRYLKPEMSPEHSDSLNFGPRSPHHDSLRILVRGLSMNNLKGTSLGIFAKILYLRWIQRAYSDRWQRCLTTLDNVIDLFIDSSGSVPLRCDRLRESVRRAFAEVESVASSPGRRETAASEAKTVVDSTIERLAKRGSPEACFETKLNVLKTLPEIGMGIMLWKAPGTPSWKTMRFHDQMSEILFCSAMVSICGSFSRQEWTKVSTDEQLRRDVNMLNHARMQVPGALPGFEDVVRLFLGTSVTMGKKANGKMELVEVVDLSED